MRKLDVPYISQHTNNVRGDCGAAVIAMLAKTTLDGIIGTAILLDISMPLSFMEAYQLLRHYGLQYRYIGDLTIAKIKQAISQGQPVIVLANYAPVPHRQSQFTGAHWFLCVGADEGGVYVHDANWWGKRIKEGAYLYLEDDLLAQMMAKPGGNNPRWRAQPNQGIVIQKTYPFVAAEPPSPVPDEDETAAIIAALQTELDALKQRLETAETKLSEINRISSIAAPLPHS